jgi:predicted phage-related endonuclease
MMDMPPLLEQRAIEYTRLQEEIKMLTTRADAIKNQIKLEGKEFKTLIGNQVKISMPTINKILFDSKRFASEHPDLYEQYKTKESSYRGFTINLLGE